MRLIKVDDYSISEFIGHNIPLYAILSHTWGDGEVSLQDTQNLDAARQKEGFQKIEFCCNQAKEDCLEWVWVDTCCIDKTSSAELSEAINSMYQWYSRSMACYAYLSDFIRGWTLQELLTPLTVQFYSSNWSYIGTKKELASLIKKITSIPVYILDHSASPMNQTVYERMHWASRRQTTCEEDMAYCLLGLFDVNLPLLYGEGKKSFLRLQEILKHFGDHSIFIWDVHNTNGSFTEREIHETDIYAGLLPKSPIQFGNACKVEIVELPEMSGPIQIYREGVRIKLFLNKVTPTSISFWPSYIPDGGLEFYLAALGCFIENNEYVTEPSFLTPTPTRSRQSCTAMLLLRYPNNSYGRVPSH